MTIWSKATRPGLPARRVCLAACEIAAQNPSDRKRARWSKALPLSCLLVSVSETIAALAACSPCGGLKGGTSNRPKGGYGEFLFSPPGVSLIYAAARRSFGRSERSGERQGVAVGPFYIFLKFFRSL